MSAQLLSGVKELLDMFDHALLHRDTSVAVRMSLADWEKFQQTVASGSATPAAAPLVQVAQEAVADATVTGLPGQEVHVQFKAGDFSAMNEAHKEASAEPAPAPAAPMKESYEKKPILGTRGPST